MAHVTFVARSMDGLILVETWDDTNKVSSSLKSQAKQLLRKLLNMPPRCSVECAGNSVFHYTMENGICYMALFDKSYPKNLAFAFLEDIHRLFQEELKREFGTGSVDYRSHIETIEKPYYFIKFDRQITKKKAEYRDPNSSKSLSRLNESLSDVQGIMRQNINEILQRGENLEEVGSKASKLKEGSKDFRNTTRSLSFQTLVQKYAVPLVLGLVVLLIICFKLFIKR
uniref:Vesicle-trafficking protein SEC22b n=1 Tax=Alexandrium catenella TaxID=2925 RepID=A0A7S1MLU2_ALECA